MMIFVLIAAPTPPSLLALEGAWQAGLLGVIWSLALCGVLLKIFWMEPRVGCLWHSTWGWVGWP